MYLYYFGVRRKAGEAGHALYSSGWRSAHRQIRNGLQRKNMPKQIDAVFAPMDEEGRRVLYIAGMSFVNGWTVVSWWDSSGDKRPGCNSTLLAQGRYTFDEMIGAAKVQFPGLMERQPEEVEVYAHLRLFEDGERVLVENLKTTVEIDGVRYETKGSRLWKSN